MSKNVLETQKLWLFVFLVFLMLGVVLMIVNRSRDNSSVQPAEQSGKEYSFKELGVKVKLPPSLENLTYTVSSPPGSTGNATVQITKLHLPNYTTLANKCIGADAKTEQSFASIIKSPLVGTAPSVEALKKFDNFYIGNLGASVKDTTCQQQSTKVALDKLNADLSFALKQAFNSAVKLQ